MKRSDYLRLIFQKSIFDLIAESRNGYIGMLWWVIEPILYMAVFYIVFVIIFHRGGEDAVSFLLVGLVVWKWFAASIPQCSNCIVANIGLIRQVYIPKLVFPAMVVTTTTIKFFIIFALLILFLVITGTSPSEAWLSIPLLILIQLFMMLALGGVLAAIIPFIPDVKLIIDNGMMLLFFLSGIFFEISAVSKDMRPYLYLNPMAGMIENYRAVLLEGAWPDFLFLAKLATVSMLVFVVGFYLLYRFDKTYPKVM